MSDLTELDEPSERLTELVEAARSGLRRDVQALMDNFDTEELLVPLARDVAEAPEGERVEFNGDLTIVPHLLPDSEGQLFAVLFTHPDPLEPIVDALEWKTDDEPLKVCAFQARVALQMALDVIDEKNVVGLVIDPGVESELCLTRGELASMLAGRALPLVAYVGDIHEEPGAKRLVAEAGEPPPAELLAALNTWIATARAVRSHRLERTFDPERDLEPHLTLTLVVPPDTERQVLFEGVTTALEPHLPPPGYLDVLFEETSTGD